MLLKLLVLAGIAAVLIGLFMLTKKTDRNDPRNGR